MRKLKLLLAALAAVVTMGVNAQTWTGNEVGAGTFFLYNVGANKFINNGDPNENWGTNAYLQAGFGLDFILEATTPEGSYNLNTNVSNGNNKNYLATTTWCDGDATPWTFEAVDGLTNTYTIKNGDNYLVANEELNDVVYGALTGDNKSYWKLISLDDFKAAMQAKTYSAAGPMDVSVFIQGRSFARNDGRNSTWVRTYQNESNQKWIEGSNGTGTNASGKYYGNEFWNQTFDIHQDITGLPDGTYELQCSGFGTNGTTYIYGNTKEGALTTENSAANGSRHTAYKLIADENAWAGQTTGTFTLSGGNLTVGLKRETNKSQDWCVYDEFRLYYYGLDLSEFAATLAAAVQAAEEVEGTIPTAAYDALAAVVTENNNTYTTAADYSAAADAIVAATNTAKDLQANYTRYKNIKAAIIAINSGINLTSADTQVEAATTNEGIDAAVATARAALASYLPTVTLGQGETIDLTDALIDNAAPGISGSTAYWTNSVNPGLQYQLYEFYNQAGATTMQTIATSLPTGNYKLTAVAFTRTDYIAKLSAGSVSTNIATVSSNIVNNRYQGDQWIADGNGITDLVFNLSEATSNIEIGLTADNNNGDHWMCWRSFRLVYGDVFEPYTLVEGKMNATVAAAQTTADTNFKNNPSPTTYMAVLEAIAAAQASKDAYVPFTTAINKIDAALTAATSATASTEAYDAIKTAYTNGTVADADIHTNIVNAYDAIIPVIKSQTAANADFTFAIQNQSFEYGDMTGWTATSSSDTGVRDASNTTYAATGSDGNYLFNTWWQGVPLTQAVTGLPNGQYTLTASVASDGATIYLLANGEHNDGTETGNEEVTTYPGKDTFQDATFTFLVKDGTATIGVVGGAEGEAGVHKDYIEEGYWWYKADNFRLVKNRNLTEEEESVAPTAITLYNGETEVTEPIALTATANTVTLTPSYTPANATEGYVTWASSDENVATVANGVVTGVAPGTATITVTSTLDATVSATATITVTYPESTVPATYYVNEDATRTIYTLGENLIKNGSFEYANPYYGWTYGTGSTTPITSEKFDIITEEAPDGSQYLKAKTNDGGAGAGSLNTSWPIEPGKTYAFGYKVKAKDASSDTGNQYIGTSLNTTKGQENANNKLANPVYAANEWTDVKYVFESGDNTWLVFNARWLASNISFDNFYLAEATYTIEGNVDYATAAIPTTNIGTGAFQYSQDAIDAANALVQGTATVAEVEAAYNAVTTLNAPEATQAYNLVFNCEGHSATGNALTLIPNPNQQQGYYGLKYLAPANVNLAQAFYFVHTTGNKYKVYAVDTDGNDRYITTQAEGYGTTWYEGIRTIDDATKAMEIEIRPNGEGLYLMWNTGANKPIAHNGNSNDDMFTNNTANFQFVETTKPGIAINTTAAGWGTTMLPFAVAELPNGVKVYTCAAVNGTSLTLEEVEALEANKPYIIEGAWNETLTGDAQGTALTYTEGLLTGVYADTPAPVGSYVLQNLNNKIGFYKVVQENADAPVPTVGANRAYLTVPSGASGVRAFYFDGETTGIDAIKALANGEATIYNTNGVQIPQLQKGMNIIKMNNGRTMKVMVK